MVPYAFGFLHVGKLPECAVAVLLNKDLSFYRLLEHAARLPDAEVVTAQA